MKIKNLIGGLLIATMMVGAPVNAHAASSANFSLSGYNFSGACTIGAKSATAVSSFDVVAGLTVSVTYSYIYGAAQDGYKRITVDNSNASTSVSATAKALPEHKRVQSVRADATHFITYRGGSKTLYTDIKA